MNRLEYKLRKFKKEMFRTLGTYGVVMMIAFVFLGLIGLLVVLGLTVAMPLMIGMASAGAGNRGGWKKLSTGQKTGLGVFLIILLPFLFLAFLLMFAGISKYYVELWISIPVALLVLFIVTNRLMTSEERKRNIATRFVSHRVVGVIALIFVVSLVMVSIYSYTRDAGGMSMNAGRGIITDRFGSSYIDYEDEYGVTEATTQDDFEDVVPYFDVYFKCFDDFLTKDETTDRIVHRGLGSWLFNQEIIDDVVIFDESTTVPSSMPVENVRCSITVHDMFNPSTNTRSIVAYTNADGYAQFNNMPVGRYNVTLEKAGYKTLHKWFTVEEETTFVYHLIPDYYDIQITYAVSGGVTPTPQLVADFSPLYMNANPLIFPPLAVQTANLTDEIIEEGVEFLNSVIEEGTTSDTIVKTHYGVTLKSGTDPSLVENADRQVNTFGHVGGTPVMSKSSVGGVRFMMSVYNTMFSYMQQAYIGMQSITLAGDSGFFTTQYLHYEGMWLTNYTAQSETWVDIFGDSIPSEVLSVQLQPSPSSRSNRTHPIIQNILDRGTSLPYKTFSFRVKTDNLDYDQLWTFSAQFRSIYRHEVKGWFTTNNADHSVLDTITFTLRDNRIDIFPVSNLGSPEEIFP